jgi:hypothetical protein
MPPARWIALSIRRVFKRIGASFSHLHSRNKEAEPAGKGKDDRDNVVGEEESENGYKLTKYLLGNVPRGHTWR